MKKHLPVMTDFFGTIEPAVPSRETIAEGAFILREAALPFEDELLHDLQEVAARAPFRRMTTPGGFVMSVAMTNCGAAGWITDRAGYRYDSADPKSGSHWPALPESFAAFATAVALSAGYPGFVPDACLINRYVPGARLSLHQDKNERDLTRPIVSVSLGLPATFEFGGTRRTDSVRRYNLRHGDVAVWGGASRLCFHGVRELKAGIHEKLGRARINLTFRSAL